MSDISLLAPELFDCVETIDWTEVFLERIGFGESISISPSNSSFKVLIWGYYYFKKRYFNEVYL